MTTTSAGEDAARSGPAESLSDEHPSDTSMSIPTRVPSAQGNSEPREGVLYEFHFTDSQDGPGTTIGWWSGRYWHGCFGGGAWSPEYVTSWREVETVPVTLPVARVDLDAIEARAAAATPGPWEIFRYRTGGGRIHLSGDDGRPRTLIADMHGDPESIATAYNEGDREFLFAVREDVPALVGAVRSLRAENAELREKLAALREHTLDNNPALRTLHDNATAYLDAVAALQEVRGAPLSTTLAWMIRQGHLIPASTDVQDRAVGFPLNLDRDEWGLVMDGLIGLRESAQRRKDANSESTSDLRVNMCADLIARIGSAAAALSSEGGE